MKKRIVIWIASIVVVVVILALLFARSAHSAPPVIPGDANGDGKVNVGDITKVERIILGLDAATPGADANLDGRVNVGDITKILRIVTGLDAQ